MLTEAERAARRAYQREWRAANKERIQTYNKNFWAKKAAKTAKEAENGKTPI
jgi:hypothetical protein